MKICSNPNHLLHSALGKHFVVLNADRKVNSPKLNCLFYSVDFPIYQFDFSLIELKIFSHKSNTMNHNATPQMKMMFFIHFISYF